MTRARQQTQESLKRGTVVRAEFASIHGKDGARLVRAPVVLVSVTDAGTEERQLTSALRRRDINAQIVLPEQAANYINAILMPPAAVLLRNKSSAELGAMAARFEQAGVKTINPPAAVRTCSSEDLQAIAFNRAGIPHPASYVAFSTDQLERYLDYLPGGAMVQPLSQCQGSAERAQGLPRLDLAAREMPVLVQQALKTGFDIRVLVIGSRPIAAVRRPSNRECANTSVAPARSVDIGSVDIIGPLEVLCDSVVRCLGPGLYGVEVFESAATGELFRAPGRQYS
jgi:[lysine-biosynthesis-protein LysW]--L-2-aminoadipate ligase